MGCELGLEALNGIRIILRRMVLDRPEHGQVRKQDLTPVMLPNIPVPCTQTGISFLMSNVVYGAKRCLRCGLLLPVCSIVVTCS
jgi:hypothetical protein